MYSVGRGVVKRKRIRFFSLLCTLALIMMACCTFTYAVTDGDFTSEEISGAVKITEDSGTGGDPIIPESVYGMPVLEIADRDEDNAEILANMGITGVVEDVELVKPEIRYGPYQSVDPEQKHAYEPFRKKDNRNQDTVAGNSIKADQLLIKMQPLSSGDTNDRLQMPSSFVPFSAEGVISLEPLLPNQSNGRLMQSNSLTNGSSAATWYKAALQPGTDVIAAAEAIARQPGVEAAEPDYIRCTFGEPGEGTSSEQWYLNTCGIPSAWDKLEESGINPGGSRDVVVAIIDTGVDYTHPDLASNMWVNTGEIPGDGIDNDGNGFVDDIHGACTVGNSWAGESGNPMDDHGHGTHVAGIVAASGGVDGTGMTGVAYNTQIMAIKAGQSSGIFTASDIAQAIYYAVDKGADVINMSFGGYGRSTVEEDALQLAFGQAVLVAAAGNEGLPNLPYPIIGRDMFPAAYPWVLGIMAEAPTPAANGDNLAGFSNWDYIARDSHEYEVMAPGVEICSTLPGGRYDKWSGTSMAAPVVSGIAALTRSMYPDKNNYSSRFVMGQIASTGVVKQGKTYSLFEPPIDYTEVNAYNALTQTPEPELSYLEHYVFDTGDIASGNNGDGIVDGGETINLAMVIRNHWGKADNVQVTLNTNDPYVTFLTNTVDYGALGTYATDDNGLIYENDVVTGVRNPFQLVVAGDTPNDHVIPLNITLTAQNGFDPADSNVYSFSSGISLIVRNGTVLPDVISEDMTLTPDKYWIIPNATVVEEGATLTVEPGTQIQFWSSQPEDPYAEKPMAYLQVKENLYVNGTADRPVEMFTSGLYPGFEVKVFSTNYLDYGGGYAYNRGYAELNYARVMNPNLAVSQIDHCYFSQDLFERVYKRYLSDGEVRTEPYYGPYISGNIVSNSYFYSLGINPWHSPESISESQMLKIQGATSGNLFDSCLLYMDDFVAQNNVYLKNYKLYEQQYGDRSYWLSKGMNFAYRQPKDGFEISPPVEYNGKTYALLSPLRNTGLRYNELFQLAELVANQLGGHITTINDQDENDFLTDYINSIRDMYCAIIGLNDFDKEGNYQWVDGSPVEYTNWDDRGPNSNGEYNRDYNIARLYYYTGKWQEASASEPSYYPTILELPAGITQADLDNVEVSTIKNNAFLNRWWDPDVNHWMRFTASEGEDYKRILSHNYWGTTSETLIEKAITHYNDHKSLEKIIYRPTLTDPPEEAYPFVTDVYVSTETEERASKVGAETIFVNVLFNRDMDQSVQPQVSFGPDMPTTDYTVNAVEGGWQTPRHWVGEFKISPLTGDGYQFFRVAGAVAADDPWLVTGNDTERFRFEIITSGTEAMNLQASGAEGKVLLSWMQDDFELLAGYNLYRSDSSTGDFTRINETIIPSTQKNYEDTAVEPGKPYYYKFTVVKSDMTESDFSNIATATPLDTIAPVINHQPVTGTPPGLSLQIYADITDNVGVTYAKLFYRQTGTAEYLTKNMMNTTGSRYAATIEGASVRAPGVEYYIEASDGISIIRSGSAHAPYQVVITDAPRITSVAPSEGPESGGTPVVISGSNFKPGAKVAFDGVPASSVVVDNSNRITAVTPPHFPATVDVSVTNPDTYRDTRLQAFTYRSESVGLSIPSVTARQGTSFEIPVDISVVTGLRAIDFKFLYDKDLLQVTGVRKGSLTNSSFSLDYNAGTPGEVSLALAAASSVTGSGSLVYIEFLVLDGEKKTSNLTLANVSLNSGAIPAKTTGGVFIVSTEYQIDGTVNYYSNYLPVKDVKVTLLGENTYTGATNENGQFSLSGIEQGAYTLRAAKNDNADGISAYDAALILKSAVGSVSLDSGQQIAANVDGNQAINSMDASYVLENSAGLREVPFPGTGKVWDFVPPERAYASLTGALSGQNFTGILIGDVSGNWGGGSGIRNAPAVSLRVGEAIMSGGGTVEIPVSVNAGTDSVDAVDLSITYDPTVVSVLGVTKSPPAYDFLMAVKNNTPGRVNISMAGAQPITGLADLAYIRFEGIGSPGSETLLMIDEAAVDEQTVTAIENGRLAIIGSSMVGDFNIDGEVEFEDLMILSLAWGHQAGDSGWGTQVEGLAETPYDRADIGPATGSLPNLVPSRDGRVNFEDLMVFAQMWDYTRAS